MTSLKRKTLTGLTWASTSRLFRVGFQFVVTMILARLLSPSDFGIIGMANVFVGVALIFEEMGLGAALIQKKDLNESHVNSIFYFNIATGFTLTLAFFPLAPLIARYYRQEILSPVVTVMSINFVVASLAVVQRNLMMKRMDFRKLAAAEITASLAGGLAGIGCALSGLGVWSLVVQLLVGNAANTALLWILSDWRPRLQFSRDRLAELLGFSVNLTGADFLYHVAYFLPTMILGRYLGADDVGYYTIALTLINIPRVQISAMISKVMFSALSIVQDRIDTVRENYLRMIRHLAFLTFPLYTGLIVTAPEAIRLIYGDQWGPVVFMVQVFALMGLLTTIITTVGVVFRSKGRTDLEFRWSLLKISMTVVFVFAGLRLGIDGVVVSVTLGTMVISWFPQVWSNRLIDLTMKRFLRSLAPILGVANLMAFLTYGVRRGLIAWLDPGPQITFAVMVVFGACSYFVLAQVLGLQNIREISDLVKSLFRPKRQEAI